MDGWMDVGNERGRDAWMWGRDQGWMEGWLAGLINGLLD